MEISLVFSATVTTKCSRLKFLSKIPVLSPLCVCVPCWKKERAISGAACLGKPIGKNNIVCTGAARPCNQQVCTFREKWINYCWINDLTFQQHYPRRLGELDCLRLQASAQMMTWVHTIVRSKETRINWTRTTYSTRCWCSLMALWAQRSRERTPAKNLTVTKFKFEFPAKSFLVVFEDAYA